MARNGTATITDEAQEERKKQLTEIINLFGGLLFFPAFLIVGIAEGVRAGFIAGATKTLQIFQDWGK
jgi:hypothetical protein